MVFNASSGLTLKKLSGIASTVDVKFNFVNSTHLPFNLTSILSANGICSHTNLSIIKVSVTFVK